MESRETILRDMADKLDIPLELTVPEFPDADTDWREKAWEHVTDLIREALMLTQMQKYLDDRFGPGVYVIAYDCGDVEESPVTRYIRTR
jgi:hypothetical protein